MPHSFKICSVLGFIQLFGLLFPEIATQYGCAAQDAMDRIAPARLEAVHQATQRFQAERKPTEVNRPYQDYRANLHVHSAFSHDSRGTIDEILVAAKAAGTQVLLFNEHPADHYDFYRDGHRGIRDGILMVPGAEMKGFLAFPNRSLRGETDIPSQDFCDLVKADAGMMFLSHLEERMDWNIAGLTGVEIYNTHALFKNQKRMIAAMRNPMWWVQAGELFQKYPQESFSAIHDYPSDYLKRWDELCQVAPHTGVSANDAHQNVGIVVRRAGKNKVRIEDALGEKLLEIDAAIYKAVRPFPPEAEQDEEAVLLQLRLDPYENSLRHVGTHLLMKELTQQAVWDALENGRAFVAFEGFADATSFDFCAINSERRWEMGSQLSSPTKVRLKGQSPLEATWKLVRNGAEVATFSGSIMDYPVEQEGVYRVELWLEVDGEDRLWILSNPIYVRAKNS